MPLLTELSDLRGRLQGDLFPFLESNLGPLGPKYQQFVTVIEMVPEVLVDPSIEKLEMDVPTTLEQSPNC